MPSSRHRPKAKHKIAQGSERHVYSVKKAPDLLLKVMKSKHLHAIAQSDDRSLRGWLRIRRAYALYRREQSAWTNAMLRAAVRNDLPPLAGIGDFVLTPDGLGQLVERVRSPSGETAPTLEDLTRVGPLSEHHLAALNAFAAALYSWHIPAYDLGPRNIVWQESLDRFVLVDGFGDRAAIPVVTWMRRANDWSLDRAFAKTAERTPLAWHRRVREFVDPRAGSDTPGR